MSSCNFLEVCRDVTKTARKIPQSDYLSQGNYKIFDQGKQYIAGYTNDSEGIVSDYPYIVFGDHTRILKFVAEPCFIGADGVKLLKVYNEDFTPQYVYYALLAQPIENQGYSRHFKYLKELNIAIYTKEEQNAIVSELDKIQAALDNKKEQLKKLDELIQSKFYEMFGDPITNNKRWDVCSVINVVTMQRGYDLPVQNRDKNGEIPIYGSNGIIGRHTSCRARHGIITGRSGTLGEVYSCDGDFWPLNTTLYSNNTHGNNIVYLKYLMTNFHLERFKGGVGVPTLNRNEFHNEPIPKVPLPLQEAFAAYVEKVEQAKAIVNQEIAHLQELLNSRMDYYFRK